MCGCALCGSRGRRSLFAVRVLFAYLVTLLAPTPTHPTFTTTRISRITARIYVTLSRAETTDDLDHVEHRGPPTGELRHTRSIVFTKYRFNSSLTAQTGPCIESYMCTSLRLLPHMSVFLCAPVQRPVGPPAYSRTPFTYTMPFSLRSSAFCSLFTSSSLPCTTTSELVSSSSVVILTVIWSVLSALSR